MVSVRPFTSWVLNMLKKTYKILTSFEYTHIHTHTHVHMCTYVCMYVRMHASMQTHKQLLFPYSVFCVCHQIIHTINIRNSIQNQHNMYHTHTHIWLPGSECTQLIYTKKHFFKVTKWHFFSRFKWDYFLFKKKCIPLCRFSKQKFKIKIHRHPKNLQRG